ncbi:MAG: metallophosphoesterase [Gemmataceae bacterium]|nr:metallophosphoesterase [Gemmataceae bacterium]
MTCKVVAVSDLHGTLPAVPDCDLLLIAGDICPVKNHGLAFQADWLNTDFRFWLRSLPARQIVFIAGNHDFIFQQEPGLVPRDLPAVYLQDSGFEWQGLKIWGTPWQPWFFDWAFNLHEPELPRKWNLIAPDTDILVVHGPPFGYGDGVPSGGGIRHAGSPSLLACIEKLAPRMAVFGHIHEGRGEWRLGETILANVTILNERYEHVYPPWEGKIEAKA